MKVSEKVATTSIETLGLRMRVSEKIVPTSIEIYGLNVRVSEKIIPTAIETASAIMQDWPIFQVFASAYLLIPR